MASAGPGSVNCFLTSPAVWMTCVFCIPCTAPTHAMAAPCWSELKAIRSTLAHANSVIDLTSKWPQGHTVTIAFRGGSDDLVINTLELCIDGA